MYYHYYYYYYYYYLLHLSSMVEVLETEHKTVKFLFLFFFNLLYFPCVYNIDNILT